MKLVTFDDGKVGRVEGDVVTELAVGSMREHFESGLVERATGNEYLLAEWKRKNGIEQKRRDSRTGWQRAQDEWAYQQRNHESGYRLTSTGMPRHEVWT
jgi:hypothetical protein